LLEASTRAGRTHLEAFGADAKMRRAARAHLAYRTPQPRSEIDIGRAERRRPFGLEHFRIDDQRAVRAHVLTERLEPDAIRMNRDHRIENARRVIRLAAPGIFGPDGRPERTQRDAQPEAVTNHLAVKAHRAVCRCGQREVRALARGIEGA